jgi:predicted Zn finger-like uncharacterized protein
MRLICPNCDAQYEVDDTAIPAAGRDVQCSSCGHGWFQTHPEIEAAQEAESALHDAPVAVAPKDIPADSPPEAYLQQPPVPQPSIAVPPTPVPSDTAAADTAEAEMAAVEAPQSRQIDEAVLAVLREEAEREMIARRLDAEPVVETQADLGIDDVPPPMPPATPSARHIALLKGEDPDDEPEIKREMTRREMLPDIEEINSSLRPGDVAVGEDGETFEVVQRAAPRSGFRSGFVLMLVLAIAIVVVYVMAPRIAEQIPGAKPALDSYVAAIDVARAWLDQTTRSLISGLQGLAGGDDAPAP